MPRSVIGRMMGSADAASGWDLLAPADILARPAGDLRPAVAEHVVAMAETICAIGLLHPVVVDRERRLLAGRHRVEAFRVLGLPPAHRRAAVLHLAGLDPALSDDELPARGGELLARLDALDLDRFRRLHPDGRVPVRIRSDLDAGQQPDAARQAEIAENDVRRDFTRPEILALTQQLRAAGYDDRPGRPKAGTKALVPTLVGIVGKSRRTIMRVLAEARSESDTGPVVAADPDLSRRRALRRSLGRHLDGEPDEELRRLLIAARQRVDVLLGA